MLADRRDTRLVDHIALLRAAMRGVKQRHPFWVEAMVVLPDLLHAIWTLSRGDAGFLHVGC
jgi:putative transposase